MPTTPVQVLMLSGDTTGRAVPGLARQVIERTCGAGQAAQAQDGPAAAETS